MKKNETIFEQQKIIDEKDKALEERKENEPEIQRKMATSQILDRFVWQDERKNSIRSARAVRVESK